MANEYKIWSSSDNGTTWNLIKSDVEGYFPCGRIDDTGRLWVFYYRSDKIYYDYSNDEWTTWHGETEVNLGATVPAEGKVGLCIDVTGRLYISFWDNADNEKYAYSNDAITWTVGDIS